MTSTWQQASVFANGITLHYTRTGSTKPLVLLAHGLTDNGLCWTRLVNALANDFDFIMLDARGHGLSDHTETYLTQQHVSDLIAFIAELELKKTALLGHSMGAMHVAELAAVEPDLLSCALLEDPAWAKTPESFQRDEQAWRNALALQRTQALDDIITTGKTENPNWNELEFLAWAESKRQLDPNVVTWIDGGEAFTNWRDLLPKINCPTLLITGDTDVRVTPDIATEAKALCSELEVKAIANAGHSIRRDQFDAYAEAVRSFLKQHLS